MSTLVQSKSGGVPRDGGAHHPGQGDGSKQMFRRMFTMKVVCPVIAGLVFLLGWEIVGRNSDPILFAPPSTVYKAFFELLGSGELISATYTTVHTLLVGYLSTAVLAILIGVLVGRRSTLRRILVPYLDVVYSTPMVVVIPLVVVWLGVGYTGRLFIISVATFIPVVINTSLGVERARPDLEEVAHSFGASEWQIVRHVILPGAVPYIIAGLRIAAGRALIGVALGEMFLNLTGLGGLITNAAGYFQTADMLAGVVVYAFLGIFSIGALGRLEGKFAGWKHAGHES